MFQDDRAEIPGELMFDRAKAQMSLCMYKEAFESLEAASAGRPDDPLVWLAKGIVAIELDKAGDAIDALQRTSKLDPSDVQVDAYLGYAFLRQGNLNHALELLDAVLARSPNDLMGLLYKGEALGEGRRWLEALEHFERARSLHPDSYAALTHVVAALANLDRFDEALVACEVALELRPTCPVSLSNKAGILGAVGDSRHALATVERALTIDSRYEDGWLTKATILAGNFEDFPRAMSACDRAKRLGKAGVESRIADAWGRAADTLLRRHRPRTAVRCLNCAILYCPNAPSLRTKQGVILWRGLHRHRKGRRVLLSAKEKGDASADLWIGPK